MSISRLVRSVSKGCHAVRLVALLLPLVGCGASYSDAEIVRATDRLRELYFLMDSERGVREGAEYTRARDALELKAWYALHLSRELHEAEALALAQDMVARRPENHWGWFALAGVLARDVDRAGEALHPSARALELAPANVHALWRRAHVLRQHGDLQEAVELLDTLPPHIKQHPVITTWLGTILLIQGTYQRDQELKNRGYEFLAQARDADSLMMFAYYEAGSSLLRDQRIDEAYRVLKRGTEVYASPTIHDYLWYAILRRQDLTAAEKRAMIDADVASLLERGGESARVLSNIAGIYRELGDSVLEQRYGDRLLELYPTGGLAEWLLAYRNRDLESRYYRARSDSSSEEQTLRERYRRALVDFIERPDHIEEGLLGEAYQNLFLLVSEDEDVSNDELYDVIQGMVEYQKLNPRIVFAQSALELADRNTHLRQAEEIARQGLVVTKQRADDRRRRGLYDTDGEYENSLNYHAALMHDALGWVYYNEERLDAAEEELLTAYDLNHKDVSVLNHLGQLYETRYDIATAGDQQGVRVGEAEIEALLDRAEEYYVKGMMVQQPGEDPNDEALAALYEKRHGTSDGYEDYLATAVNRDREARKAEIMASRIDDPEPVTPFELNDLNGHTISWEQLQGKVTVINFWGIWCGPCVIEMPEFQKLHEYYRDDADVVILTVDTKDNPDELREWMAKREFDFVVLLDDGYVDSQRVDAFPTTWFLDGSGRIVFAKRGWSESLAEEFSWRVEALRRSPGET
jgi:thiol-disulfide isomerase/thioredoxin/Tfp pilus assembly protein PilF